MPLACTQNEHAAPNSAALPFGGLGIGLENAIEAAAGFRLREFPAHREMAPPQTVDHPVHPSGYALLTALGREIRGR